MLSLLVSHFTAELRRVLVVSRRYPLQTFSGMLTILILFLALLSGARYIAGPLVAGEDRQGSLIVGLVLWNMLILSISEVSVGLQNEAQIGTLEHLFLASRSLLRVVLVRAAAGQLLFLATNSVILTVLTLATRTELSLSPAVALPLLAAFLATSGIGLALGAAALLWKKIGASLQLVQFLVVSLVVPPFEQLLPAKSLALLDLLPLVPAAQALRDLMARGISPGGKEMAAVLVNGLGYFAAGILVFRAGERRARRKGALAGY